MQIYDYIWLGGNDEFRSKVRILNLDLNLENPIVNNIPIWNYDGSSTGQASSFDSEVILKPCAVFKSPLTEDIPRYIVLCETFDKDGEPLKNNHRQWAKKVFDKYLDEKPWYGLEQEYFIYDPKTNNPIGYNEDVKQGQYYCSVGTLNTFGRNVAEKHMMYCLRAGINLSGINAEVAPGQWEFQVGVSEGINAGDELLVARYLLELVAEEYGLVINWHPKPLLGDVNGSGCHTNFSTFKMRQLNGLSVIEKALEKLALKHQLHLEVYGKDNHFRLTGTHETSSIHTFTIGRANRNASVRIGYDTINYKRGYFEDRRPASNCNPYLVTAKILDTICS
jgi:glutamine synthetase